MNTTEITQIKGLAERKKNVLCIYACTKSLVNEYKCEDGRKNCGVMGKKKQHKNSCY